MLEFTVVMRFYEILVAKSRTFHDKDHLSIAHHTVHHAARRMKSCTGALHQETDLKIKPIITRQPTRLKIMRLGTRPKTPPRMNTNSGCELNQNVDSINATEESTYHLCQVCPSVIMVNHMRYLNEANYFLSLNIVAVVPSIQGK